MKLNSQVIVIFSLLLVSILTTTLFQNCGRISASEDSIQMVSSTGSVTPPVVLPPPSASAQSTEFYKNVKPILETRCLRCHSAGNVASHISFESSDKVAEKASFIKPAVVSREMPPFDVSQAEGCNSPTFANDARLQQSEIDIITKWIDQKVSSAGKLIDSNESQLALTKPTTLSLVVDGITVFAASMKQTFTATPPPGKVDEYRCFVIDSLTTTDKYMTAYQVFPGNTGIVHHMILYQPKSSNDAAIAQSLDTGSGYECNGGASAVLNGAVSQFIAADPLVIWAPGVGLQELPLQTGLKVFGGRKLVLQVHYNIANQTLGKTDKSKVLLKLSNQVQWPADWLIVGASGAPIPAGQTAYLVSGQAAMPSGYSGFYGVFPHMHSIGKKIRIENASTGQCYSFTPNWRFEWQLNYFYNSIIPVSTGNQIQVKCTYDSTSRSNSTSFGEGSGDEMCIGFVYAVRSTGVTSSTPFALTPTVSGAISALNVSSLITYNTADVSLLKTNFVVGAVPKAAGGYDYYFLSNGTAWTLVGTDLSLATWLPYSTSQNVASNTLSIFSGFDLSAYPAGSIVYAGYGVDRNGNDAKADLLLNQTWGVVYQKP